MEPNATVPIPAVPAEPCDRCGAFARLVERAGGHYCATCLARVRMPLASSPVSFSSLMSGAWAVGGRVGLPAAALLAGIPLVPELALHLHLHLHLALGLRLAMGLLIAIAEVVAVTAAFQLAGDAIEGLQPPSVGRALQVAASRWRSLFRVVVLVYLATIVASVLLVVPGLAVAATVALAVPIVLHEGLAYRPAMTLSGERSRGHRLAAMGAYAVAGVLPFATVTVRQIRTFGWLHRHPHQHLPLSIQLGNAGWSLVGHALFVLPILVTAVFYAKTRPEPGRPRTPAPAAPAAGSDQR